MGLKGMFVLAADGPETMEAPADSSTEIAGTASGNSLYSVLKVILFQVVQRVIIVRDFESSLPYTMTLFRQCWREVKARVSTLAELGCGRQCASH